MGVYGCDLGWVPPLQPVKARKAVVVVEEIQTYGGHRILGSMALGCFRLYLELQWV
jgi:hypothetical protein